MRAQPSQKSSCVKGNPQLLKGPCEPCAYLQVYEEVLDWDPAVPGARCMLEFGDTSLITQVPEPSTLPPPAPPETPDHYSELQFLPQTGGEGNQLHAAFHEASNLCCPGQQRRIMEIGSCHVASR